MIQKLALTYDDILLIPEYSTISSRKDIRLDSFVTKRYGLVIPLVAAPMDTVCEEDTAYEMLRLGGVGCIHRFLTIDEQCRQVENVINKITDKDRKLWNDSFLFLKPEIEEIPIMAAIGVKDEDKERASRLVKSGTNILIIDVAHGHHTNVYAMINWCKRNLPSHVDIIAGNVATLEAANDLVSHGADGIRSGIGGGSVCSTRIKTGFGVPNVTVLEEICPSCKVPVMADGGIRTSGDIAKALALGASTVMLGSLIAGTEESPGAIIENSNGLYKRYRGSASLDTKISHGQEGRNVEGVSTVIPYKGGLKYIVNDLTDGLRSALSYGGAYSLGYFKPKYLQVTTSGIVESKPHINL